MNRAGDGLGRWIVSLGGAGFLPGMPGTWGSAAAAAILWLLYQNLGAHPLAWQYTLLGGVVLLGGLCVALGRWACVYFGREDPGAMVLDEAAAICLTMFCLPAWNGWREIVPLACGLAAFRIFDIWKPPLARQLEALSGGWGILLDDLAAAVYANLVCQLLLRFFLRG